MSNTLIAFFFVFVGGIFASLFVHPAYGVYLYLLDYFICPMNKWWMHGASINRLSLIISVLIIISYIIHYKKFAENKIFSVPQTKWFLLFCLLIAVYMFVAVDKVAHKEMLIKVLKYYFLYYFIIKTVSVPEKYEKFILILLLGEFFIGFEAFMLGRNSSGRVEGIGPASEGLDANTVASVLVVGVPLLINYLLVGQKWQKLCALFMLVFVVNGLILFNSRGAFLAILVSCAYYFFYTVYYGKILATQNKLILFFAFIGAVALFFYLADPVFWERMGTISDEEDAGRRRIYFWLTTFDMLKDHPLGVGARGFQFLSPLYLPEMVSKATGTIAEHSTYFEVLVEYGVHGFILFSLFLISHFVYLRNLKKRFIGKKMYYQYYSATALESGFLAFLIAAIFINRVYSEFLYIISALIGAFGNVYNKKMQLDEDT